MKASLFNFLVFLFLLSSTTSLAQDIPVDSLLNVLKTQKEDTSKVKTLKNLCIAYDGKDNELATKYIQESFQLATKLNYQKGIAIAYIYMGQCKAADEHYEEAFAFYNKAITIATEENDKRVLATVLTKKGILHKTKGEYNEAIGCYTSALKIDEETGDKKFIARDYGNLSVIYWNQGNYPKAIEIGYKVLKLFEEIDDKQGIAATYSNLGSVYANQGDSDKALEYFLKALKMNEAMQNKYGLARMYSNIGVIYLSKKKYDAAEDYYLKALKLHEELKNKEGSANCLGNIGLLYELRGTALKNNTPPGKPDSLYNKALDYYFKSLKMDEELQDTKSIAVKLGNIGSLYTTRKEYKNAENYLLKALALSTKLGALDLQKNHEDFLYQLYNEKGDQKNAFLHYKQSILYKDSLYNKEKNKELARYELNYEFEKKEAATKAEQEKKDAVTTAENKKQKLILIFISSALLLVFIFTLLVLRSLQTTRKQKRLIEIKNKETGEQKAIIEEKQKEILQSINYARRIQNSLLPTEKYIERNLKQQKKI